jgi:hypothetical protein
MNTTNHFTELELEIYFSLHRDTRKLLEKTTKNYGHPYKYKPYSNLLRRLSRQFNLSSGEVYNHLMSIRQKLIS